MSMHKEDWQKLGASTLQWFAAHPNVMYFALGFVAGAITGVILS